MAFKLQVVRHIEKKEETHPVVIETPVKPEVKNRIKKSITKKTSKKLKVNELILEDNIVKKKYKIEKNIKDSVEKINDEDISKFKAPKVRVIKKNIIKTTLD